MNMDEVATGPQMSMWTILKQSMEDIILWLKENGFV